MKPKAAILIDNLKLKHWQKEALDVASKKIDIVLVFELQKYIYKKRITLSIFYIIYSIYFLLKIQRQKIKNMKILILKF